LTKYVLFCKLSREFINVHVRLAGPYKCSVFVANGQLKVITGTAFTCDAGSMKRYGVCRLLLVCCCGPGRQEISIHVVSVRWQVNADLFFSDRKHVCIEPPPSALNVTLPAIAAERRRTCSTVRAARSISRQQGAQQQTRRPLLLLSIDGRDRRTKSDRRTDARALHRPCCKYYAGSANSSPRGYTRRRMTCNKFVARGPAYRSIVCFLVHHRSTARTMLFRRTVDRQRQFPISLARPRSVPTAIHAVVAELVTSNKSILSINFHETGHATR